MKISSFMPKAVWAIVLTATLATAGTAFAAAEKIFATPDEAVKALQSAAEAKDKNALREIFGPDYDKLSTKDPVQDAQHLDKFSEAMRAGFQMTNESDDRITLEVGTNHWPLPIPLVKTSDGHWHFDTAAGKEEIINRHIGKDELYAIGVCEAYVTAQKQFAGMNNSNGVTMYAEKFRSSSGKKDGLYWHAEAGEEASPLGALVAEAHAEGYHHEKGSGPHAFHGYFFRILTKQGAAAPGGKMDYIHHGMMSGGFALVAYPDAWDQSGVMTFIVGQDGKIYQKNLGARTMHMAGSMKEYNPDESWEPVKDKGVERTMLEQ